MPASTIDDAATTWAFTLGVIQLAFDMLYRWIEYLNDLVASQAVTFAFFELARGTPFSSPLLFHPGGKFFAIDP